MNRRIMASVLMGAMFALNAGDAQAAEKVVKYQLYGVAHVSLDSLDDGQDASTYVSANSSRIGLKGDFALTDALTTIWQVECDASLDESGGQFASRNSYVGLSGAYGELFGGRHDTAFEVLSDKLALFRDQLGDARNIIGNQGAGWNRRNNDVIAYRSPALGGMSVFALHSPEDGADQTDISSVSAEYKNNGLFLTVAGEIHGKGITAARGESYMTVSGDVDAATGQPLVIENGGALTSSDKKETGIRVGGSYTRGGVKLTALYETIGDAGGVSGADASAWGAGIAYSHGKHTVKGQYYGSDGVDGVANNKSSMIAIGYDHKLAENTKVYVAYAATDNDDNAASSMSSAGRGDGAAPAMGDDPSGASVGLVYSF